MFHLHNLSIIIDYVTRYINWDLHCGSYVMVFDSTTEC